MMQITQKSRSMGEEPSAGAGAPPAGGVAVLADPRRAYQVRLPLLFLPCFTALGSGLDCGPVGAIVVLITR